MTKITTRKGAIKELGGGKRSLWKPASKVNLHETLVDEMIEDGVLEEKIENGTLFYRYSTKGLKVNKDSEKFFTDLVG